jgi:phage-related holin
MKAYTTGLLKTYDWHSAGDFLLSLMPSVKYKLNIVLMIISCGFVDVDKLFGLSEAALIALLIVFVAELVTGVSASVIRKESISSIKLSRFGLKVACYLVLIYVSYTMGQSFAAHNKAVGAWVFDWLNVFLIVQITLENIISILENLAVISGKEKTTWINKIQDIFKVEK